jgi:hypothetical protein
VNVGGFFKVTAGQAAPVVTDYAKVVELVKREVPEMEFVVQRGRGWSKVVSDTASEQLGVGGIDIKNEPKFASVLQIVSGKLEDLAQPGTALIFDNQAEKLGVKVGDAPHVLRAHDARHEQHHRRARRRHRQGHGPAQHVEHLRPHAEPARALSAESDLDGGDPDHVARSVRAAHPRAGGAAAPPRRPVTGRSPSARLLDEVPVGVARGLTGQS